MSAVKGPKVTVYAQPNFYADILEKNKENLKTVAAYEKSKRTVDAILGKSMKTKTKIDLAIEYLLSQCEAWGHAPVVQRKYSSIFHLKKLKFLVLSSKYLW